MAFDIPDRPRLTLFAGPNGAGKTTAYRRFVEAGFEAGDYLNPDDIARLLGADSGDTAFDLRAGREVIRRTRSLIAARQPFVRETTLSGREILRSVSDARASGYRVVMVFVGVRSTRTTGSRVAVRVASGGHDIPQHVQERRLPRSFDNACRVAHIADFVYFLDNAGLQHKLVATVREGTIVFHDSSQAEWLERATAGLPRAPSLFSRDEALSRLREAEGLSDDLRVREGQSAYSA